MAGIELQVTPWPPFHAEKTPGAIQRWLEAIGEAGVSAFRGGMGSFPPASAPGAWPNSRSGALQGSISKEVSGDSVTIGTSPFYAIFLRFGTSKMARRRMSDSALEEGMKAAEGRLGHWVQWVKG